MSEPEVFEGIDWASGKDRGYHVVTIGPDATPETVQAFRDAYDLGVAWAEAEAALPWGFRLEVIGPLSETRWQARYLPPFMPYDEWHRALRVGSGNTPVEALRALAVALREVPA